MSDTFNVNIVEQPDIFNVTIESKTDVFQVSIAERGIDGKQGIQGEKGETGSQGIQGIKGDTGIQGEKGDKGDTGSQGLSGLQGEKGEKGDTGATGLSGSSFNSSNYLPLSGGSLTGPLSSNSSAKIPSISSTNVIVNDGLVSVNNVDMPNGSVAGNFYAYESENGNWSSIQLANQDSGVNGWAAYANDGSGNSAYLCDGQYAITTTGNGNNGAASFTENNKTVVICDNQNAITTTGNIQAGNYNNYNTFSGNNWELGTFKWASNVLTIGTEQNGTGVGRSLAFETAGTTKMTILSSGNVGIGTTTPNERLTIVGNVSATGIVTPDSGIAVNSTTQALTLLQPSGFGPGTVSVLAGSLTTVRGVGTLFITTLSVGETITIGAETRTITAVTSDILITVSAPGFTAVPAGTAYSIAGKTLFSITGNGNILGPSVTSRGTTTNYRPTYSFTADDDTGISLVSSYLAFVFGGTPRAGIDQTKLVLTNAMAFTFSSTTSIANASDTSISRLSGGIVGIGTGVQGSIDGSISCLNGTFGGNVSATGSLYLNGGELKRQAATNYIEATTGFSVGLETTSGAAMTPNVGVTIGPAAKYGFASSNSISTVDTAFTRLTGGVVVLGTGAVGNTGGTLVLATLSASTNLYTNNLSSVSDIEITSLSAGIILRSPNNTRWRVTIGDDGALISTAL